MSIVLIVDDNRIKRNALAAVLADEGYTIIQADDGEAGLALARAEKPDLVITDMIMPKMDGYDFCKGLRADPGTAGIPVVVNSIMEDSKIRILMREYGVHFFIPLGAKKKDIMDIINAALTEKPQPTPLTLEELAGHIDDVLTELKALSAKLPQKPG